MKIDDEFRRLLSSLNREVSLSLREDELRYRDQVVFEAQKKGNLAAVPLAYSNAKLHAFERRARVTIDRFMSALENCDIELDDAAEKDVLREIAHVTVGSPHLMFPPAIQGQQAAAIQESHAQNWERLRHQLYKEAANRLREEKIKARSRADANARLIRIRTEAQPGDHSSVQGTLPSQSAAQHADFNRDNNLQMAGQVTAPIRPPRYTPTNVKREARKLATEAKYKSWQKQYRLLRKSRPSMSDVWYSQKIAGLPIASGSKAETIRRHMKR